MRIERLHPDELPALDAFFDLLALGMPQANLKQFSSPRLVEGDIEVVTFVARDSDRIVGTIGWLRTPLLLAGQRTRALWPINFYVHPEYRGLGLGKNMLDTMKGDKSLMIVLGGTDSSIPLFEKMGAHLLGHLATCRWFFPNLSPGRLHDRLRAKARSFPPKQVGFRTGQGTVLASRTERPGAAGLDRGPASDNTVPHGPSYLDYAFGGPLASLFACYRVTVDGEWAGHFVLSPAADRRPFLAVEVMDLDALPGQETAVLEAARRTAFRRADIVRLRMSGRRFTSRFASLPGRSRIDEGAPFRAWFGEDLAEAVGQIDDWHLTYADHDEFRQRSHLQKWSN